jgi:sulfur carrier protein ThiS
VRVNVKLYGTLAKDFPEYRHSLGMDVEIPEEATVDDLLGLLNIPPGTVAVSEGRILKGGESVAPGTRISILQSIHGG